MAWLIGCHHVMARRLSPWHSSQVVGIAWLGGFRHGSEVVGMTWRLSPWHGLCCRHGMARRLLPWRGSQVVGNFMALWLSPEVVGMA